MAIYKQTISLSCNFESEIADMNKNLAIQVKNFILSKDDEITVYEDGTGTYANYYLLKKGDYFIFFAVPNNNAFMSFGIIKISTLDPSGPGASPINGSGLTTFTTASSITALTRKMTIVMYVSDNGNFLFKINGYQTKAHGITCGIINTVNSLNSTEQQLAYYNPSFWDKDGAKIGNPLTNANIIAIEDYVYLSTAEMKNTNNQLYAEKIIDVYEVAHDGGMIANSIYTIDGKNYLYADNLLWQC